MGSDTISGVDVTATWQWADILRDVFLEEDYMTVVADNAGELAAIVPLFVKKETMQSIPCRQMSPVTEQHAGRCGFLLRNVDPSDFSRIMNFVFRRFKEWDVFKLTLVRGSASEAMFARIARESGYNCMEVATVESPYIDLTCGWESYLETLDNKFQSQLRNRERKLNARGRVEYELIESADASEKFAEAMLEIEQESWKESAGTSVTANEYQVELYRRLIPIAANRKWLSAHLLRLNGEPIGYILGLLYNNVFCGLKHSYKANYRSLAAGHLIQFRTIKGLCERGVRIYDFMGTREPHKMVWTTDTYARITYILYNHTARARLAYFTGRLKKFLKSLGGR